MNFTHNHSEGPWNFDGLDVMSKKDQLTIDGGYIMEDEDIPLIVQAPAMRDYMIERANDIKIELSLGVCYGPKRAKEELSRILEILRAAGVEVVE